MSTTDSKLLELARKHEQVLPVAVALGETLLRMEPQLPESLLYAVLVLVHKISSSDVCVRLNKESFESVVQLWQTQEDPEAAELYHYVQKQFTDFTKLEQEILSCRSLVGTGEPDERPLILWQGRLYLRRYFLYERQAASFILKRQKQFETFSEDQEHKLKQALPKLFGSQQDKPNFQQIAALIALRSRFAVITGGPGTGKTTTVTKLLLLLLALSEKKLEIKLCAPTGKAAEHMNKSIAAARNSEEFGDWVANLAAIFGHPLDLEAIPEQAQTLHALLRVIPHRSSVRVNAANRLNCDVLVVDEVSMVDLPMFAKLSEGLRPNTRLILLGDKDQLFSVESGSVLSDLCAELKAPSAATLSYLCRLSGLKPEVLSGASLSDTTVFLIESHRFKANSGIGELARAVNEMSQGREEKSERIRQCFQAGFDDLKLSLQPEELQGQALRKTALRIAQESMAEPEPSGNLFSYRAFLSRLQASLQDGLTLQEAQELFGLLNKYRILCSNRKGALGQDELNRLILTEVKRSLKLGGSQIWFPGRVILITKNNQSLRLANGDVGFVGYLKGTEQRELRVFFEGNGHEARAVRPIFLTDYEDGYAMTVHKSQGSEYDEVLLVLANYDNPVLTKELVYTGVTRAKKRLCLCTQESILRLACMRSVQRESGLPLWLRQSS